MADAADLKSALRKEVWVRVPPSALLQCWILCIYSYQEGTKGVIMKKWSLPLKVFLIVLAVFILYVLIAGIIRVSTGQVEAYMAVIRFVVGCMGGAILAGVAAAITALVLDFSRKKKLSLTLEVFYIAFVVCVLFVLIAGIIRVFLGQYTYDQTVVRFIIGSIGGILIAGIAAGIAALAGAIKNLGA